MSYYCEHVMVLAVFILNYGGLWRIIVLLTCSNIPFIPARASYVGWCLCFGSLYLHSKMIELETPRSSYLHEQNAYNCRIPERIPPILPILTLLGNDRQTAIFEDILDRLERDWANCLVISDNIGRQKKSSLYFEIISIFTDKVRYVLG